jgi:hypothetical protein
LDPHVFTDGVSHVLPLQQPVVHVIVQPWQALFTHWLPPVQVAQAMPPEPHAPGRLPGWHALFAQQPPGQLVPLHTHAPLTHARPAPHAAFAPHWQAPPTHESDVFGSHVVHEPPPVPHVACDCVLQVLPLQQPFAHDCGVHVHDPLTHA